MSPHIPSILVKEVRDRATEVCEYCRLPQLSQEATFHIDHAALFSRPFPDELIMAASLKSSAATA